MDKVLIADSLSDSAERILRDAGLAVDVKAKVSEDELVRLVPGYAGLVVRSATKVTRRVIEAGAQLRVIGRAGVGVDNIDVESATARGIIVMNTPLGNIQSAAEHTIAMLFSMARNVPYADRHMKEGQWPKKESVGSEFSGKILGVIGLGRIGRIVSRTFGTLGMRVVVYDPFLTPEAAEEAGARSVPLDTLLAEADFITIHTPLTDETRNLIGADQLKEMKRTARIVNCARGGIVNEAALIQALDNGVTAGAALDVFTEEPLPADAPLRRAKNLVLTPHLGASTEEAQLKVAEDIAHQFVSYFKENRVENAVNLSVTLDPKAAPFADLAEKLGRLTAQLADGPIRRLVCRFHGKVVSEHERTLAVFVLKGLLGEGSAEPVNLVNAPHLAKRRGIELSREAARESVNFTNLITVSATAANGEVSVKGTLFDGVEPRVVGLWDFAVEFRPKGHGLVMRYPDMPGMIGRVGTILGEVSVNIGDMAVGRMERGKEAAVVLTVDDPVPESVMAVLAASRKFHFVRRISL